MSIKDINKIINKIIIFSAVSLLYSFSSFADDFPLEIYHVEYNSISKDVLKNTIGILTISGDEKATELKTYSRIGKQFIFDKILKVKKTIPISNFGYYRPMGDISDYRYPIVAKYDQYLCIVYDPIKNLKTWVNAKEIEEKFSIDIVMLDNIPIPAGFFVDIFYFTKSGKRKVYKMPKKDADFFIISKEDVGLTLTIIEQKNDFVKIGIVHVDYDTYEESIEPIGWIRIRDDQGMLMIWIRNLYFVSC